MLLLKAYHKIEEFAKRHTLLTTIIIALIPDAFKFTRDKLNGVDYEPVLNDVFVFLNINFTVKAWHILVLIVFILIVRFIWLRWPKAKNVNAIPESVRNSKSFESSVIGNAKHPYNSSRSADFLGNQSGMFSIWAFVADIHNELNTNPRFKYIISYATNKGNTSNNPSMARYPNAWAIHRITPTKNDHYGIWRFWCNNVSKESTIIDYSKPLQGGWHLFTVAWSSKDNYIKFIIDQELIGEKEFAHWPSDFSSSMILGTWPTRTPDHFFDSKIGPYKFTPIPYNKEVIDKFLKSKPQSH